MIGPALPEQVTLEGQTLLARLGSLPTRADVAQEALSGLDDRYLTAVEAMETARTPSSPVYNDIINSKTGPWKQMLGEAFFGDDVDGSLKRAQDTMQSILDASN